MREKRTYADAGGEREEGEEEKEEARKRERAMVEGKLLIRARLNACLGSHFPCRSSPCPKEDERRSVIGRGRKEARKNGEGGFAGATVEAVCEKQGRDAGTSTPAGGAGLMKSVCPVKVKINWRSGGGYRDNQPGPVVFKLSVFAPPIAFSFWTVIGHVTKAESKAGSPPSIHCSVNSLNGNKLCHC